MLKKATGLQKFWCLKVQLAMYSEPLPLSCPWRHGSLGIRLLLWHPCTAHLFPKYRWKHSALNVIFIVPLPVGHCTHYKRFTNNKIRLTISHTAENASKCGTLKHVRRCVIADEFYKRASLSERVIRRGLALCRHHGAHWFCCHFIARYRVNLHTWIRMSMLHI